MIKRHKIPIPNCEKKDYYQLLDFNVGVTVEFYGKQFKIIGADNFTREFLRKAGVDVPENLPMPNDSYFISREQVILLYTIIDIIIYHGFKHCYITCYITL